MTKNIVLFFDSSMTLEEIIMMLLKEFHPKSLSQRYIQNDLLVEELFTPNLVMKAIIEIGI